MSSEKNINKFKTVSIEETEEYQAILKKKQEIDKDFLKLKKKYEELMTKLENYEKVEDDVLKESYQFKPVDEYYKNPTSLPIDQLAIYIENGDSILEISAISSYWTQSWTYGYYEDSISIVNLAKLSEGFQWLLKLPFYKFWSQIFLVKNTTKAIKSFISQNNLYYHSLITETDEYNDHYTSMYHSIYKILLRLVQTEPSSMEKISVDIHSTILQNVITYDMILPICKFYGNNPETKVFLRQLFKIQSDLRTNGLASIGIECKNVLPFLSDYLNKLPAVFKNNPQHIHLSILLLLNFIEDFCAIEILLSYYPPFRFIIQYLQMEQQIIDYVGSHLFVIGKILKKITEAYGNHINHDLLWTKYFHAINNILKIYRIFINETIDDIESVKLISINVDLLKMKLHRSTKRYIQFIKNLFKYNFLSTHYVFMFNIKKDNQRIKSVFSDLSESDKEILNELEDIAQGFQNTLEMHDLKRTSTESDMPQNTLEDFFGTNFKLELTRALTSQMRLNEVRKSSYYEDDSDDEEFNKTIEQCLLKGFIRGLNDNILDCSYELHIGLDGTKPSLISNHLYDANVDNSQATIDETIEMLYQRLVEIRRECANGDLQSSTESENIVEVSQPVVNGNVDQASYADDDADIKRALSESLKETTSESELPVTEVVFQSLISEVKDILPHLGEGFITECLKHYKNNTEEIISAILEQKLPPNLASLDENMPIIPVDTSKPKRTVFDGDEFDRMTKLNFDPTRIFRKKNKVGYKNASAMLNDKTHIKSNAELYEQYSLDYYDDDFDDGVDEDGLKEREVEAAEDIEPIRKPINARRQIEEESSEESDNDEDVAAKPTNAFCEDPAVLRARAEERRKQKYQKKGSQKPSDFSNVAGNPKGQGQDKNVLINRAKKNENKSQRGNHNRRSGAQWKRSRGMVPS